MFKIVSFQSEAQRRKGEKIKKCKKRTRLSAVICSSAKINRRPNHKPNPKMWCYKE